MQSDIKLFWSIMTAVVRPVDTHKEHKSPKIYDNDTELLLKAGLVLCSWQWRSSDGWWTNLRNRDKEIHELFVYLTTASSRNSSNRCLQAILWPGFLCHAAKSLFQKLIAELFIFFTYFTHPNIHYHVYNSPSPSQMNPVLRVTLFI